MSVGLLILGGVVFPLSLLNLLIWFAIGSVYLVIDYPRVDGNSTGLFRGIERSLWTPQEPSKQDTFKFVEKLIIGDLLPCVVMPGEDREQFQIMVANTLAKLDANLPDTAPQILRYKISPIFGTALEQLSNRYIVLLGLNLFAVLVFLIWWGIDIYQNIGNVL